MFTTDEKKKLREEFWSKFKSYSNGRKLNSGKNGKWIMDQTDIKQLKLKFHFDENIAWAGIVIDTLNMDKRIDLFDKLEKMKTLYTDAVPYKLIWELEHPVINSKTVSIVYSRIENVSIYNKSCWKQVQVFLYEVMAPIEDLFLEYKDFIKYQ